VSSAPRVRRPGFFGEDGLALVVTLMAITLLLALGASLVLTTMAEGKVAGNYRDGTEALYAADGALERILHDVDASSDWNTLLDGSVVSSFTDGAPAGRRIVEGGAIIDLVEETNMLRCGKPVTCSIAEMDASTVDRPWGSNNPRWQLYAYGRLADLAADRIDSRIYVVVWVADDPAEDDENPMRDGDPPAVGHPAPNPGGGIIVLRARSLGAGGISRTIQAVVTRGSRGLRVVSWRTLD
jgi:hypothetical protein